MNRLAESHPRRDARAERASKRSTALDEHVGARIRLLREMRGLSQSELGAGLGVSFQQLQKYERAWNRVSAGRLFEIAEILGVDVGYFFEGLPDGSSRGRPLPLRDDASALFALVSRISDARVRKRVLDLIAALASDVKGRASLRTLRIRAGRTRR